LKYDAKLKLEDSLYPYSIATEKKFEKEPGLKIEIEEPYSVPIQYTELLLPVT